MSRPLDKLPQGPETWLAGSVRLHRWLLSPRGHPLRPDAFVVVDREGRLLWLQVVREGPGFARSLDFLKTAMHEPHSGVPRRPNRILVADDETADWLSERLGPEGIEVSPGGIRPTLERTLRKQEAKEGETFPLAGLRAIDGYSADALSGLFAAAARYHRARPWRSLADGEAFALTCTAWEDPTWFAAVLGSVGDVTGLSLHPDLMTLLDIYRGRTAEEEGADAIALAYGNRTQIPFDDLDAVEDLGLEVDGKTGYPLVFRSRPGSSVTRPSQAELEVLEASLLALAALSATRQTNAPKALVEVETSAGRRRVRIERVQ